MVGLRPKLEGDEFITEPGGGDGDALDVEPLPDFAVLEAILDGRHRYFSFSSPLCPTLSYFTFFGVRCWFGVLVLSVCREALRGGLQKKKDESCFCYREEVLCFLEGEGGCEEEEIQEEIAGRTCCS